MAEKQLFQSRKFLNPKTGMAAIEAMVDLDDFEDVADKDKPPSLSSISAMINITDCSRSISLDFDVYSYNNQLDRSSIKRLRDDLKARVQKARALRDALIDFTEALERAAQMVRDQVPIVKEHRRLHAAPKSIDKAA